MSTEPLTPAEATSEHQAMLTAETIVLHTSEGDRDETGRTLRALAVINRTDRLLNRMPDPASINPASLSLIGANLAHLRARLSVMEGDYDKAADDANR